MAGAGYKLFVSGDVLTAAQVNTYLQQQVTMVFANSTARTTALSGVLAEGMMSYLQDTNAVEVYNGSSWVNVGNAGDITGVTAGTGLSGGGTSGDVTLTNDMATTITASGDIIVGTGSGTFDNLPIGTTGQVLTADTTVSPYKVKWASASGDTFTAGKNKIINGDFYINQRAFSSTTTAGAYGFDRWYLSDNTTVTYSAQNFTAGTAPVAGYEGKSFARCDVTTSSAAGEYAILIQPIEDVRTLAGQTVTISLWAKASSGTPKLGLELYQSFGSGGSAGVSSNGQSVTISTAWTRYSATFSVPSISGKTIGTSSSLDLNLWFSAGSNLATRSGSVGNQTAIIDVWGVQVEIGSSATSFQTATGTIAGELALCQRYFNRFVDNSTSNVGQVAHGRTDGNPSESQYTIRFNVDMRTTPTLTVSAAGDFKVNAAGSNSVATSITAAGITTKALALVVAHGSLGTNAASSIYGNATTAGRMDLSAEL